METDLNGSASSYAAREAENDSELLWQKRAPLFARRSRQGRRHATCCGPSHVFISKKTDVNSEQTVAGVPTKDWLHLPR